MQNESIPKEVAHYFYISTPTQPCKIQICFESNNNGIKSLLTQTVILKACLECVG